jgi:type IV pilus assembly protein PilA
MVHCRGCGKELHETAEFCPSCWAPQAIARTGGKRAVIVIKSFIFIAIIGILASVAISSYDYNAGAQVAEGVGMTGLHKTPLAEYYAETHDFTGFSTSDLQGFTTGKYVDSVTIAKASKGTIVLVATFKGNGSDGTIFQGKEIRVATEDGGITWACGYRIQNSLLRGDNQLPRKYLPLACK